MDKSYAGANRIYGIANSLDRLKDLEIILGSLLSEEKLFPKRD